MKRAKLGDVYAFKTDRGYRLLQWAYKIEKYGEYTRVFPGFYQEQPSDIQEIVDGDCAYISDFSVAKLYRKGLLEYWGNYPINDKIPFPSHDIRYTPMSEAYGYSDTKGYFEICESTCHIHFEKFLGTPSGEGIPEKYKNIKLICGSVDPVWFIYLISSDFDLSHWNLFWPGDKLDEFERKYGDLVFDKRKTKT